MSEEQAEEFALRALENSRIVPADRYERLVTAARLVIAGRETGDLKSGGQALADSLVLAEKPQEPWVLVMCEGGLVQQIVGLPDGAYEICDADVFQDEPLANQVRYFNDRSLTMQEHLRSEYWNHVLPRVLRQAPPAPADNHHEPDISSWENEGGKPH